MTSAQPPAGPGAAPTPVSLYAHVPFCVSKCAYCAFRSEAGREELFAPFVDAALAEVSCLRDAGLLEDVPTLYFGGGTPTVLGSELLRLVRGVLEAAGVRPDAEITVETNPESTDPALVRELVAAGANRFSLGVQSFDDGVLRALGRCHDARRAAGACATLAASGVPFSIDLICGVPGQTMESWRETLERATGWRAVHASVYPLTVEEGTPLAASLAAGLVEEPDPDLAADMMLEAASWMTSHGLARYEVASYAAPGCESRHNTVYWTGGAYLGVGPGAASMLPAADYERLAAVQAWERAAAGRSDGTGRVRFARDASTEEYLAAPCSTPDRVESLTPDEARREDIMLGMRLVRGVPIALIEEAGLGCTLRALESAGLVEPRTSAHGQPAWSTTERGWLLGDRVFGAIWNA